METDEEQTSIPFQLQFDKPVSSQIKIAEWNPEKDLLAMVTEDSKILLHRFNWQRLWTISPGRCITALCWRPDGKAIAVGLEDGTISLHDVENGKLLRSIKSHNVAVVCLNWEEDGQLASDSNNTQLIYEDRTSRFFPSAPRVPRMPGVASGDTGFMDESEDSFRELSNTSHQRFNILCSGDKEGTICFSIFGIFPIGKININKTFISAPLRDKEAVHQLVNSSIYKVALSKDLCHLIVMCFGELVEHMIEEKEKVSGNGSLVGLHCLLLDTSIFRKRKNELHQVAQQASNIEDFFEVIRASLSIMCKQWADAMHVFHEKFDTLSPLIADNGLDSSPQEEFLSLLGGARTSPPVHQFLVSTLGEVGLKRVTKAIDNAGKELHLIVREHLQPAAEIVGFRIGELRGLSRWRARYQGIGLDEKLIDSATERAGMLLVQVERLIKVLAVVVYQFQNFFLWLSKCIKLLMSESSDQLPPFNSELVIVFLKFLYDQDPVRQLLEVMEGDHSIEVDSETMQRVEELVQFGGFSDTEYLQRTLAKEFELLEYSFKEAFLVLFTTISKKIHCKDLMPLFPVPAASPKSASTSINIPASISFYEESQNRFLDYTCFRIPDKSFSDMANCIGITRGFKNDLSTTEMAHTSMEAVLLIVPDGYNCVDVSLYKDTQIVLLLNETVTVSDSSGRGHLMILRATDLPFVSVASSSYSHFWNLQELKESAIDLNMENEKVRSIPHSVIAPLAVSASRGVACVFAARKRALVYILEEDEDEGSDIE